jgi:hypothetical protein
LITVSDLIALLTALLTAVGAVIAILVFRGDRAELRELESVTALINMKSPRDAELRATQKRLLDRYLRGSKRRASGSTWLAWSVVFGGIGAIAYFVGGGNPLALLIVAASFFVALLLMVPFYIQLVGDTARSILARVRNRGKA